MGKRGFFICWTILILAVLVPFFMFEDAVNARVDFLVGKYSGDRLAVSAILFCFLAADIFLPVPSCLASAMCGLFLGPCFGFLTSFSAMCVSSIGGLFIGRFVCSLARRLIGSNMRPLEKMTSSRGPFTLFILRPVPVLAECSAIYAGLTGMPARPSMMWMALGNAVVSAVYVLIGCYGSLSDSFVPAFAAVVVLSGGMMLIGYMHKFLVATVKKRR